MLMKKRYIAWTFQLLNCAACKNLPCLVLAKAAHSLSVRRYQVKHLRWINITQV